MTKEMNVQTEKMDQKLLHQQMRQVKEIVVRSTMKKKVARKNADNEEILSEYISLIINERNWNQEVIIRLGLKTKSRTRKKKLRITLSKKIHKKKSQN